MCRSSTFQPTFETLAPAERLSTVSNPYMVFTNCFHEFSQFEQLKTKIKFLMVKNRFFFSLSQFGSWKRNHNKYSLKKFVDSEFEIGETIWWICYMVCSIWNLPERRGSKSFSSNTNFVIMAVGKFEGIFTTVAMKHTLNFATVEGCMNFSACK